ncbi:membrane protein insertion efficiency factor YidD [Cellulomonas triticagri]|uniref:Putative membrane protein insertion efficiency factor n=1 Tax=Cellulomonas triticagri TaxID=2483352 RepID=A0A3M2JLI6_9CELL|nr:membrane protein insertion efficiency factor YidD [Cellulomonas triticagri]RMI14469.1 membrane protein insertion efficiency factor YidD [Cellulomonas triticagri]
MSSERSVASTLRAVVRLPRRVLVLAIRGYQRFLSPLTPPTCRFYPSCSAYAVIALERHGVVKGTRLAVWRILRCNPWNRGGVDDVPPAGPHRRHPHGAVASAH